MNIKLVKSDWLMGLYINGGLVQDSDFIDFSDVFKHINREIENNGNQIKDRIYFEELRCDERWLEEKGDFPAFFHQVVLEDDYEEQIF